jgi:hypothetical protein
MISGYFEHVDTRGARGWVSTSDDAIPNLLISIDDHRFDIPRDAFKSEADGKRRRFDLDRKLRQGARVEILDATDGAALAGGVRMVAIPGWQPRIAIVTPMRWEANYLTEWIAYHRALGVQHFVIGDNGGGDGTSEKLRKLDAAGIIMRLDWRGAKYFQMDFYNRVIPRLKGLVDIIAVIDTDEFMRPLDGRTSITQIVSEYFSNPDVIVMGMNWAIYGSSGRIAPGDGLLLERFTQRADRDFEPNRHIKCFIRSEYFIANNPNPHFFNYDRPGGRYVDSRGDPFVWDDMDRLGIAKNVVWNAVRLDHYIIKSWDEYQDKIRRGSGDNATNQYAENTFRGFDRNEVHDPADIGLIARTRAEMRRIERRMKFAPLGRYLGFGSLKMRRALAGAGFREK